MKVQMMIKDGGVDDYEGADDNDHEGVDDDKRWWCRWWRWSGMIGIVMMIMGVNGDGWYK